MMMDTSAVGPLVGSGTLSDGAIVSVYATDPMEGTSMEIEVEFQDAEHINYDLTVTQNDMNVLTDEGAHVHGGKSDIHTTMRLGSSDPVTITFTLVGYGISLPYSGPVGEELVFPAPNMEMMMEDDEMTMEDTSMEDGKSP